MIVSRISSYDERWWTAHEVDRIFPTEAASGRSGRVVLHAGPEDIEEFGEPLGVGGPSGGGD